MEHEIATGPNMSIMQQFSGNNLFKMVHFWMVAFSYGINLLFGQDLTFVKGFLPVSYSILKCILSSISCEDIREGKLFTSREKNPRVLSISIHHFMHKCNIQVVFNTWWQFKHSLACQKPAQQCSIVFPPHHWILPTILLPPGPLTPTSGGLSRTAQLVHLHWALWS